MQRYYGNLREMFDGMVEITHPGITDEKKEEYWKVFMGAVACLYETYQQNEMLNYHPETIMVNERIMNQLREYWLPQEGLAEEVEKYSQRHGLKNTPNEEDRQDPQA